MIVRILILIEFIFPLVVQGQSLTLDDLIHIEKLSIAEVNNYLLKKNWTFLGTKDSNDGDKTTKWDFYENGDQNSNSATVDIIHQNRGDLKIISYEVANQLIYQQMTKTAKLYKMRIIGENSRDNSITSVYEGTNYNLMIDILDLAV